MNTIVNKPLHGFRAWICFFIGLNIIFAMCAAGLVILINAPDAQLQYIDEYFDLAVRANLQDTILFKSVVAEHISYLQRLSKNTKPVSPNPYGQLEVELTNIACHVKNKDGVVVYDTLPDYEPDYGSEYQYNYLILIEKGSLSLYSSQSDDVIKKYLSGDISGFEVSLDNNYAQIKRNFDNFKDEYQDSSDVSIVYAVRSEPENFTHSIHYLLKQVRLWTRIGAIVVSISFITAVLLIIYSSVKREDKRSFFKKCARFVSRIWFEVKLVFIALVAFVVVVLCKEILYYCGRFSYPDLALVFAILILCFWFFYLIIKDLQYNKSEFFKQNSIRALIRAIQRLSKRLPFVRRMIVGFWLLIVVELVLIFLFAVSFDSGFASTLFFLIGVMLFVVATILYHRFISDTGKLISQINRIKSGDLTTRLELRDNSDLYEYAHDLNSIQTGMSKALEEQLASERLKVDLITNVSHDLKTPLTSIISYIDLLKKENLPEQAVEYTEILSEKADRLKTMIQDIFAVSKASSGNLDVEMELLDLGRLVDQTLADMQERVDASGLTFRVHHVDDPLFIRSDCQRLYRVLQNLIDNALCYSLDGSRVHIRLWSEKELAKVEIKNTSNLEFDFSPDEIVERFVRGDISRSGKGSGLGLSIAKTFTEACGGSFRITIDYDDFKVRLAFPLEPNPMGAADDVHTATDDDTVIETEDVRIDPTIDIEADTKPDDVNDGSKTIADDDNDTDVNHETVVDAEPHVNSEMSPISPPASEPDTVELDDKS